MKNVLVGVALVMAVAGTGFGATVEREANGIVLHVTKGVVGVEVWGDGVVHVRYAEGEKLPEGKSLAVVEKPEAVKWNVEETAGAEVITTPRLRVEVNRESGAVTFLYGVGKKILAEADGGKVVGPNGVRQEFAMDAREVIYGLGQHQSGAWGYRGSKVHLQQENREVGVPVLVSSGADGGAYGILWDNAAVTDVEVGVAKEPERMAFASEVGAGIDYYFLAGPEVDGVVAEYRALTGDAPMLGRWAWGLWQSKERYHSQEELLGMAKKYREMHVPLDGVVQDWQYWGEHQWGSQVFDAARYPDPAGMMKTLHEEHVHALISVWPKFDEGTATVQALEKIGAVFPTVFKSVYPPGNQKWYDPFNAAGRELYWSQVSKNIGAVGFDGWWLDASEGEFSGKWGEFRKEKTAMGPGAEVYNAYPLMHTTGVYEGARRDYPEKRAMILTRSAYAGQQRNAAITWSGDIKGSWDVFRKQIPAGLNFSISGIPYWNTDIGGFFGGDPKDPKYAELFTRWCQFGAFCPMFRVHGTGAGKEIWQWDEGTRKTLVAYDRLRYRLLPYIYSTAWAVTNSRSTMMRPLVMDFRTDGAALSIGDQYLFGPALMVNPVVRAGAMSRKVYLPGKGAWWDFWTGKKYEGGVIVEAAASVERLPLFVKAGSIVPMGPAVEYADQDPAGVTELRVYRGADGHFDLYEDAGDGYGYEKGERAEVPLAWEEKAGVLKIGARRGSYPGMSKERTFHVVVVGEGNGVGGEVTEGKVVEYVGEKVAVKFE